jgi:choline dehydrogenase-like flavoprotein
MSVAVDCSDLRLNSRGSLDADVLVIGSGAGGSAVAATAAEMGFSVVVLEEGPYVPAAKAPSRMVQSLRSVWRGGGLTVAYGSPPVSYAEGRCVGGSTEINSSIFQRAPENILAEWSRRYAIRDFSAETLEPFYDWAAQIVNASPTSGPLGAPTEILAKAGNAMGWQVTELERGQRSCVGTNMCAFTCPTGGKQSMSSTLLPQIMAKGHRVIANAKVRKLRMKGPWIEGVDAVIEGGPQDGAAGGKARTHRIRVKARKVFLCAGAIQTPALLQNAGFGGPVGKKLRLHPTIKMLALFDEQIDAQNHRLPLVAITEFMPDMRLGGSIFTASTFGLALTEDWRQRASWIKNMRRTAIFYAMVRGQGYGRVYAMPGGAAPIVTYKLDGSDWQNLGVGVARLGQALLQAGATHVLPSLVGHPGWQEAKDAAGAIDRPLARKKAQLMSVHLFGSCPMGENPALCAADSYGRMHGAANLYLADASLIPEAPGVNPQATVMALARRNALHVLKEAR